MNAELLRNRARWWAVGNGVAVVAGAAAIGLLTRWRRAPLAEH